MFSVDLVVVGLGYVGMPLVQGAVSAGLKVQGFDASQAVVDSLNAGRSHVDDLSDADVAAMLKVGFRATTQESIIASAECVVVCVPTPLGPDGGPDLTAVRGAAESIGCNLQAGSLVVLESTTWPGTTEEVFAPILSKSGLTPGVDFAVAFSPERIDPGNPTYGLRNTPKVVGGLTASCGDRAEKFYSQFIDIVVRAASAKEAEMAKLLENTYRHINIALVNEMAKFSHELDIDFWDVIRCAATKPFGFQPFYPGPGVGGHCIPIDPNYLSYRVRAQLGYPFRFVELAQEINHSMPEYIARRVQDLLNDDERPVKGSKIVLLGVTYKPDIADERESPALDLAQHLLAKGASLSYHDPMVPRWEVGGIDVPRIMNLRDAVGGADVAVLLQAHSVYDREMLSAAGRILDTRGVLEGPSVVRL